MDHQLIVISEHTAKPGAEGHFNAEVIYKTEQEADEYLKSLNNEEVVLFFTDFHFPLSQRKFAVHHRSSRLVFIIENRIVRGKLRNSIDTGAIYWFFLCLG